MPFLRVNVASRVHDLELASGELVIGSDDSCDVRCNDTEVATFHATLGQQLVLRDTGSVLGTFLRGYQVLERIVRVGDTFELGPSGRVKISLMPSTAAEGAALRKVRARNGEVDLLEYVQELRRRVNHVGALHRDSGARERELSERLDTQAREATATELRLRQQLERLELSGAKTAREAHAQADRTADRLREQIQQMQKELAQKSAQLEEAEAKWQLRLGNLRHNATEEVKQLHAQIELLAAERRREVDAAGAGAARAMQTVTAQIEEGLADARREQQRVQAELGQARRQVEELRATNVDLSRATNQLRAERDEMRRRLVTVGIDAPEPVPLAPSPSSDAHNAAVPGQRSIIEVFTRILSGVESTAVRATETLRMLRRDGSTDLARCVDQTELDPSPAAIRRLQSHVEGLMTWSFSVLGLIYRQGYRQWSEEFLARMSPAAIKARTDTPRIGLVAPEKYLWRTYSQEFADLDAAVIVEAIDERVTALRTKLAATRPAQPEAP